MPEPVREYHRLLFDDTISAARWADRLATAISAPRAFPYMAAELRPVIWRVFPHGAPARPGYVFLSEGAMRIARELGLPAGPTASMPLEELPNGLSLVLGDAVDLEGYGRSRRGGSS